MTNLLRLPLMFAAIVMSIATISLPASSTDLFVSPNGDDANDGSTSKFAFGTIQHALEKAVPGDTISLASGTYNQDFKTVRPGTQEKPITITGPVDAVIIGGGSARIIEINHSYITLKGFTVDGLWDDADSAKGYRDKLIYAQGKDKSSGLQSLKILNMHLQNAGGECVRLRYFVEGSEIAFNSIKNCGIHDFKFGGMKEKNGEGIYIGTAPEQRGDGKNPTSDPDRSSNNWIHNNDINTQANECVDTKENADLNTVENNSCTGQLDPNSGGFDFRSNNNIIRYNTIKNNNGSGIRMGGDTPTDGSNNQAYGNNITNNKRGGFKFEAENQQQICGNTMANNTGGDSIGSYGELFSPTTECLLEN